MSHSPLLTGKLPAPELGVHPNTGGESWGAQDYSSLNYLRLLAFLMLHPFPMTSGSHLSMFKACCEHLLVYYTQDFLQALLPGLLTACLC